MMRKLLLVWAVIFAVIGAAFGQLPLTGVGPGGFGGGGVSYQGPGDTVSGATMFIGLTAYNAAYATGSNPAADICDSATMAVCSTINILSTGYFDAASASASLACAVSCSFKRLYDQTGNGNHYDTFAGNLVFFRLPLTFNCLGSLPCVDIGANANSLATQAGATNRAQPYTVSRVNLQTGYTAQLLTYTTANSQVIINPNTTGCFAGASASTAAADGTWFNINTVFNGASSDLNVQGTSNTNDCGTTAANGTPQLPSSVGVAGTALKLMEIGLWPSAFSAGNSTTIAANRKTVYGY